MDIPEIAMVLAAFLCTLVAGFLFAFWAVVMPGIRSLADREFVRAFQVMDGVIQNNQPVFLLVWVGSVVAMVTAAALGLGSSSGIDRLILVVAALAYLLGVQLPTIAINVPLNNKLQTVDIDVVSGETSSDVRREFEPRWNRWNSIRTGFAAVASALLILLLQRM